MAICKECGTKNPDEAKFCSECGGVLATIDATAVKAALDKVEKEFEKDAKVSLDRSRLTYICDICGKVNPIDTPDKRCVRCGKKMPRSEYVKALQRIKEAKNVQQNLIQDMPQDNLPKVMPNQAPAQAPEAVQPPQPVLYRMNQNAPKAQGGVQQNGQIIQPFVIVPYVSQNQPLLQYNPNTVYRYHQYSDSEKRRNQETLARLEREREEAERERLARMENDERAQSGRKGRKYNVSSGYKKPNGRRTAFISVLCAIAAFVVAILTGLSESISVSAFVNAPDEFFKSISLGGVLGFVGLVVFAGSMIGLAITAGLRIWKKSFKRKQLLFPLLALIGTVLALVGCGMDKVLFKDDCIVMPIVMILASVISISMEVMTRTNKQLY